MTFFEWRKFSFFELKKNVNSGKLAEKISDFEITATASGNNQIYLGDSLGQIHKVIRNWQSTTFVAYSLRVLLAFKVKHLLVTIGEDEEGINPVIKVWDTTRLDKNEAPFCTRITKTIPNNSAVQANTLCVHENCLLMAVGFTEGSLILYRGDITRDRSSKPKLLRTASSAITGLAFKNSVKTILLFVSTENAVYVYNVTTKDKETMLQLDTKGCARNCTTLASTIQGSHFMVARNDAVYCFTADGLGPCYAIDGVKVLLEWFRTYLIIVSRVSTAVTSRLTQVTPSTANNSNSQNTSPTGDTDNYTMTVLDIKNKFMVFTTTVTGVKALINELGGFYVLDTAGALHQLDEKDLQSKLQILFKKNLYDVAIRIAESQKHDPDALIDIFRQYGDHLYGNGDHAGAIEQYIKTIGKLEPSYVIRKFLDSQHIEKLTSYLQAVHKKGRATEDHTTLLLNCFTKLSKTESLKEFILQKDKELEFDVDIAIKVCRNASPDEALMLAKKHGKHDLYIKFLLEDHHKYAEAINYLATLDFDNAELYMRKYGNILVANAPKESTKFLQNLCSNYVKDSSINMENGGVNLNNDKVEENKLEIPEDEQKRADAFDFISFYLGNSEGLVELLEYLIKVDCPLSAPVFDTLLEHYLYVWEGITTLPEKSKHSHKLLELLQNADYRYDRSQALVMCHARGFSAGLLHLYADQKLYGQILAHHVTAGDYSAVLACCRRFGHQEPGLWVQALREYIGEGRGEVRGDVEVLQEILTVITTKRLLSPQLVIDAMVSTGRADITLGHLTGYIRGEFLRERETAEGDAVLTGQYRAEMATLREEIEGLQTGITVIRGSRCAACNHQLELPSLHFLCQHSYHQYCFQSISETETDCPVCHPEHTKLVELLKARGCNKDTHEQFHSQLEKASDGFALAAEYYGRGVFNKITVVTDTGRLMDQLKGVESEGVAATTGKDGRNIGRNLELNDPMSMVNKYGPGAEAKMRQEERLKQLPEPVKLSEGRMRAQESRYSSSWDNNITTKPQQSMTGSQQLKTTPLQLKITTQQLKSTPPQQQQQLPTSLQQLKVVPQQSKSKNEQETVKLTSANPFDDEGDEEGEDDDEGVNNPFSEDARAEKRGLPTDYDKNKNYNPSLDPFNEE